MKSKRFWICIFLIVNYGYYILISVLVPLQNFGKENLKPFSIFPNYMLPAGYKLQATIINSFLETFSGLYLGLMTTFIDVFAFLLAQGVVDCLEAIKYNKDLSIRKESFYRYGQNQEPLYMITNSNDSIKPAKPNQALNESLIHFNDLRSLVEKYNAICAWIIFLCKGWGLILIVFFVYSTVYFQEIQTLLVFITIAVPKLLRLFILIIVLGNVREASNKFKDYWIKNEQFLNTVQKRKLYLIQPIVFKAGPFYILKSCTILRYYSIIVTYCMVVLQIFSTQK